MVPYSYSLTSKQNVPRLEIKFEDSPFGVMKGMWEFGLNHKADVACGWVNLFPEEQIEMDMGIFPYLLASGHFRAIMRNPVVVFDYTPGLSKTTIRSHLNLWERGQDGAFRGTLDHGKLPNTHPLSVEITAFTVAVQPVIDGEFFENSLVMKRRHEKEKLQKRHDKQMKAFDDKIVIGQHAILTNGWIKAN